MAELELFDSYAVSIFSSRMNGVERKTTVGAPKEDACSIAVFARLIIAALDSN